MLRWIHEIRIGTRLAVAYALVLALLVAMAGVATLQAGKLARNTDYYDSNIVPSIELMRRIVVAVEDVRRYELEHVVAEDIASSTEAEEGIVKSRKQVEGGLASYEKLLSDEDERLVFGRVKADMAAYFGNWDKLKVLSEGAGEDAAKDREAKRLFRLSGKAFLAVHKSAMDWGAHKEAVSKRYHENSEEVFRSAMLWLAACSVFALLGGVASAIVMTRSITRPLAQALSVARTVAAGDLTSKVEPRGRDEPAQLLRALEDMNRRLIEVVGRVRQGSDNVAVGSREIASGNSHLSARTERQAASLEQTSASMDELSTTVHANADTATKASAVAAEAALAARRGGESMGEAVKAMDEISATSHRIAEIISVVDGIAFQTNILALNAAVEAARAGEQGRGFAVVASEVRALAVRSAEAAKDIKRLIEGSVEKVDRGMTMVADTGRSVDEMVGQVQRVSDMLAQIARASGTQTESIGQVSRAVSELEDVTQQNAALVEESAAAADSLRTQAQKLVEAVGIFKLGSQEAARSDLESSNGDDRGTASAARLAPGQRASRRLTLAAG